jgi:parallel beta-helix repeat protein
MSRIFVPLAVLLVAAVAVVLQCDGRFAPRASAQPDKAKPREPREWHVSLSGDDHNPGTREKPLRHIANATGRPLVAGDTVVIHDGVYNGDTIVIHADGKENAWITVRPLNMVDVRKAKPRVTIVPGKGNGATLLAHSYIRIEGLEISGGTWGVTNSGGGHHTVITNNLIHDTGASGIQLNDGDYRTITGNVVHGCAKGWKNGTGGGSGISICGPSAVDHRPGFHNVIAQNISHSNADPMNGTDGNGIILDSGKRNHYAEATLIENNVAYNNGGAGIHVYSSVNVMVRNNAAYGNRQVGNKLTWRGDLSNQSSDDVKWINNIGWSLPTQKSNTALLDQVGKGSVWQKNISFNGKKGDASFNFNGKLPAGNLYGYDPKFVDPAKGDFHLRDGSPAIGAGTTEYGVPKHERARQSPQRQIEYRRVLACVRHHGSPRHHAVCSRPRK